MKFFLPLMCCVLAVQSVPQLKMTLGMPGVLSFGGSTGAGGAGGAVASTLGGGVAGGSLAGGAGGGGALGGSSAGGSSAGGALGGAGAAITNIWNTLNMAGGLAAGSNTSSIYQLANCLLANNPAGVNTALQSVNASSSPVDQAQQFLTNLAQNQTAQGNTLAASILNLINADIAYKKALINSILNAGSSMLGGSGSNGCTCSGAGSAGGSGSVSGSAAGLGNATAGAIQTAGGMLSGAVSGAGGMVASNANNVAGTVANGINAAAGMGASGVAGLAAQLAGGAGGGIGGGGAFAIGF